MPAREEKELEKHRWLLYNQIIKTTDLVIPGVFDNLTNFEPTLLT